MVQKYACRERDSDADSTPIEANSYKEAAERYADNVALGYDRRLGIIVDVMLYGDIDGPDFAFKVGVEWKPTYHATEVKPEESQCPDSNVERSATAMTLGTKS